MKAAEFKLTILSFRRQMYHFAYDTRDAETGEITVL
jgi:hypothetical protein